MRVGRNKLIARVASVPERRDCLSRGDGRADSDLRDGSSGRSGCEEGEGRVLGANGGSCCRGDGSESTVGRASTVILPITCSTSYIRMHRVSRYLLKGPD